VRSNISMFGTRQACTPRGTEVQQHACCMLHTRPSSKLVSEAAKQGEKLSSAFFCQMSCVHSCRKPSCFPELQVAPALGPSSKLLNHCSEGAPQDADSSSRQQNWPHASPCRPQPALSGSQPKARGDPSWDRRRRRATHHGGHCCWYSIRLSRHRSYRSSH